MQRRNFLKFSTLGVMATGSSLFANKQNLPKNDEKKMASIIDIDLCDGCKDYDSPKCVQACKEKNKDKFPVPQEPMMDYWPQKKHEDYSKQKDNISRLTPYNFTFIQSVKVGEKTINIPRRCMHCDNPPCQKICPFGVISKSEEGAVLIDDYLCFGGAKCQNACPWGIPQRQAGVGVYLKVAPKLAGGGVMFKCDMCADLLKMGKKPSCESACPKGAIKFGARSEIENEVKNSKKFVYGKDENAGTSTFYLSSTKFEDISDAIELSYKNEKNRKGKPHLKRVKNPMQKSEFLAYATLIAPLAGIGAGIIAAKNKDKK